VASAVSLVLLATVVAAAVPLDPTPSDPLAEAPRVIRYVSSLPTHEGQVCYGVVLADANGIPIQVRALVDRYPELCQSADAPDAQPQLLRRAFEAADAVVAQGDDDRRRESLSELLPQEHLADVVLAPVAISQAQLDSLRRFVVGVGLNYAEHQEEVGQEDNPEKPLVFPKPVVPTGPYQPVNAGVQIGEVPPKPVLLLDYEVELGLVVLQDIELADLPPDYEAFIDQVAFFTANDVSDREPIILDQETGYTRGKSHPTYLPIGPWMVHGRHLRPRARDEGEHSLEIGAVVLQVQPSEETPVGELPFGEERQLSTTDAMLRGPWAIVRYLSDTFRRGEVVCMRDASGQPRFVHNAGGVIPAGSIILTGTPGGTAIREPRLLEKAESFVFGGFTVQGARKAFIEDVEENIAESAYLEAGDRVESWVESLGQQRWSVVADPDPRPYGVEASGACESGSQPRALTTP
jgi:2-keto-4-pentenoate hydratase/2-oxohepta-3-ene-1,7-dioic acid hydratase in catechol pathway